MMAQQVVDNSAEQPTKAPAKRAPLGLKVSMEFKCRIDAEARATGLSQSQVVERRARTPGPLFEKALGEFDEWKRGLIAQDGDVRARRVTTRAS